MGLNCSFVELEAKFNASSLLLNSRHFDKRKHSWQWCKENSQNSETPPLTKKLFARLLVERYKKKHLVAQVRSANGLRGIFKFSEILGRPSYWDVITAQFGRNLSKFLTTVVPRAFYYERRDIKYPYLSAKFYQNTRRRITEVSIRCVHRYEGLVSVL